MHTLHLASDTARTSSLALYDEQAGALIPFSVERIRSTGQALHLQSTAAEWDSGHTVVADAQTCIQTATPPTFLCGRSLPDSLSHRSFH